MAPPAMPWGKYCGQRIDVIPLSYLVWALEEATSLSPGLRAQIREVVADRLALAPETGRAGIPARPPSELTAAVHAIVRTGYRQAAHRVHPDHGGSTRAMQALTAAHEWLTEHVCSGASG